LWGGRYVHMRIICIGFGNGSDPVNLRIGPGKEASFEEWPASGRPRPRGWCPKKQSFTKAEYP
jgi:hypothetical protein